MFESNKQPSIHVMNLNLLYPFHILRSGKWGNLTTKARYLVENVISKWHIFYWFDRRQGKPLLYLSLKVKIIQLTEWRLEELWNSLGKKRRSFIDWKTKNIPRVPSPPAPHPCKRHRSFCYIEINLSSSPLKDGIQKDRSYINHVKIIVTEKNESNYHHKQSCHHRRKSPWWGI